MHPDMENSVFAPASSPPLIFEVRRLEMEAEAKQLDKEVSDLQG